MTTLLEVLKAIKDPELNQAQCESYRDQLLMLSSDLELEYGALKKEEAIFGLQKVDGDTETALKRKWRGSESGLRLIMVKSYIKAVNKACDSLKQRIFSMIR